MLSKVPEWLAEPDIRTYSIEPFELDYISNGEREKKSGFLLTLQRNTKIRRIHFFSTKREAKKLGERFIKTEVD